PAPPPQTISVAPPPPQTITVVPAPPPASEEPQPGPFGAPPAAPSPANPGSPNSGPANSGPANSGPPNSGPANSGPANSGPSNPGTADHGHGKVVLPGYSHGGQVVSVDYPRPAAPPPPLAPPPTGPTDAFVGVAPDVEIISILQSSQAFSLKDSYPGAEDP